MINLNKEKIIKAINDGKTIKIQNLDETETMLFEPRLGGQFYTSEGGVCNKDGFIEMMTEMSDNDFNDLKVTIL